MTVVGPAQEKGFFEREGLRVRMITFCGTNLMLAALSRSGLDPQKEKTALKLQTVRDWSFAEKAKR